MFQLWGCAYILCGFRRRQRARINATDAVGTGNGTSSEYSKVVPLGACINARPNCFCISNFRFFPNIDSQPTPAPYEKTGKKITVRDSPTYPYTPLLLPDRGRPKILTDAFNDGMGMKTSGAEPTHVH